MTFTFKLPDTTGEFAEHVALQELALYLVDAAAGFTLRRDAKQRSEKARLQATEALLRESHHERQEVRRSLFLPVCASPSSSLFIFGRRRSSAKQKSCVRRSKR